MVSMGTLRQSGIGRTVLNVASEFIKKGHTVGFVTEYGDCSGDVCWVQYRTRNPLHILMNVYKVFSFVRKYDVIICYDVLPNGFMVAFASFVLRIPFYLHCVGTYSLFPKKNFLKSYVMTLVYARATNIFVLSNSVRSHIEKSRNRFSLKNSVIAPPGVEVQFFKYTDEQSVYIKETPYIITVGAVKSRKGHDVSIEAFGKIAHEYPKLKYVIVGQYDRKTDCSLTLDSIIDTYNIRDRVIFLESVDDYELCKLYSHASFFIMTSRTTKEFIEGFGIVYLEAALCGIPSIGALDTGAEDAIIDGQTGLLVRLDADTIKFSMKKLLDNPGLTNQLGKEAQIRAANFSWDEMANTYLKYMPTIDSSLV